MGLTLWLILLFVSGILCRNDTWVMIEFYRRGTCSRIRFVHWLRLRLVFAIPFAFQIHHGRKVLKVLCLLFRLTVIGLFVFDLLSGTSRIYINNTSVAQMWLCITRKALIVLQVLFHFKSLRLNCRFDHFYATLCSFMWFRDSVSSFIFNFWCRYIDRTFF